MSTINLNVRTDKSIKERAEKIYNELGFSMTTAINMFLRSTIRENGIPFSLKVYEPNDETIEAIEEGEKMLADPNSPRYSSIEELKEALESK